MIFLVKLPWQQLELPCFTLSDTLSTLTTTVTNEAKFHVKTEFLYGNIVSCVAVK